MSNLILRKRKDITEEENDIPIFLTNLPKKDFPVFPSHLLSYRRHFCVFVIVVRIQCVFFPLPKGISPHQTAPIWSEGQDYGGRGSKRIVP